MDENKNYENEQLEEAAEEATNEVIEETEEVVEEAIQEAVEAAAEEIVEATEEAAGEVGEETEEAPAAASAEETEAPVLEAPKKNIALPIIVAAAAAVVVALVVWLIGSGFAARLLGLNKYNRLGYVDISGKTVADLCEQGGITLEEFLEMYELPEDMTADTTEAAAYYSIPLRVVAEMMYGMDVDTFKEMVKLPAEITEDTPWGKAEGEIKLIDYVGEERLEEFKAQYGFGEEITGETKWKEVRNTVDMAQKEANDAAKKAADEAAEDEAEAPVEDAEAPAEDGAAEEEVTE